MPTLTHREVGDRLHILNYTLGEIMSFERSDGRYLLDALGVGATPDGIDDVTTEFLVRAETSVVSRSFRSALINLGMEFSFPTVANLELNRRCVLRCQHCYIPTVDLSSKDDSEFEASQPTQLNQTFDSLRSLGVFLLVLTGGEVFLNRRFRSILDELRKREFVLEIFSSLQFLPDWFPQIDPIDYRIGRIQTSVYSVSNPLHDQITGTAGSMKRTLETIDELRARGFYVEVATPLMELNFDARHEIESYFQDRGIKHSFAWPILSEYYDGNERKSRMNMTDDQFVIFCNERPDYLIKLDTTTNPESHICPAGRAVLSVSANGDVFSCSQYPMAVGNINSADVADIYRSPAMRRIADARIRDIGPEAIPYNFCMGNNYSETGDPMRQSPVLYQLLKSHTDANVVPHAHNLP